MEDQVPSLDTNNLLHVDETYQTSAAELFEKCRHDGGIKIVKTQVPFADNLSLFDISLDARGDEEDEAYAYNDWYRSNIRRGNTIIQSSQKCNGSSTLLTIGRKGFEKFFDLRHKYLELNLAQADKPTDPNTILTPSQNELYKIIFAGPRKSFEEGDSVHLYKLTKANGENAQISWIRTQNAWLISSKNVGLLAKTEKDIRLYNGQRFEIAKLIASEWFRQVNILREKGLLEGLKQCMNGKTFVGEYCGHEKYQHLVHYEDISIQFVAIVDNNSSETCLPPQHTLGILEKYELPHVKFQDMGLYDNWEVFNQALKNLYKDVAESKIESEEEGSVLYIVKEDKLGSQRTLSLCKLKTLEYRIYRKLREKLRSFLGKNSNRPWREVYNKFHQEVEGLCRDLNTPMPIGYYMAVAREGFTFANEFPRHCDTIRNEYITFLTMIMYSMSQQNKLKPNHLTRETIARAMSNAWTEYEKCYKPREETKNGTIKEESKENRPKEERLSEEVPPSSKKLVYVFIPLGMSNMCRKLCIEGFIKHLESKKEVKFTIVSDEETRKDRIESACKGNKKLSIDDVFDKTANESRKAYNEMLGDKIFVSDKEGSSMVELFLLDRMYSPYDLKDTIASIVKHSQHLKLTMVALVPKIQEDTLRYTIKGKEFRNPFSTEYFLNWTSEAHQKENIANYAISDLKKIEEIVKCFNGFRNFGFMDEELRQIGLNHHITIPINIKDKTSSVDKSKFEDLLIQVLEATKPGEKCPDSTLIKRCCESSLSENCLPKEINTIEIDEALSGFMSVKANLPGDK